MKPRIAVGTVCQNYTDQQDGTDGFGRIGHVDLARVSDHLSNVRHRTTVVQVEVTQDDTLKTVVQVEVTQDDTLKSVNSTPVAE